VTVDAPGLVFAVILCLAAGVAHFVLRRAARRLPRWLAARRGIDTGGGSAPGELAIALGCFVTRVGVWLVVLRVLAERFQVVRGAQVRFESLVGMSVATPLFALGERSYSIADLLTLLTLLAVVWAGIGMLAREVRAHVARLAGADRGVQDAVTIVVRYGLSVLGTIILLQAWGIDVSSLTIVASVLGVGIGFGMQNIANNFVSGFLLTLERPIKPGDFVQVGELMGTVERIGTRSTEVRTLDRVSILVPNAHLLEKEVINWSHGDPVSRIAVPVSIEYGGDLRRARAALLEAARAHREVLDDPRPAVELRSFGESGIEMALLVWTREPRRQHQLRSDLNFAIFDGLTRHGVAIPFPQQDVHVHAPALERAMTAWSRRTFSAEELAAAEAPDDTDRKSPELPALVEDRTQAAWSENELAELVERMRGPGGLAIQDRRHLFATYARTFVGSEAAAWLREQAGLTREEALLVGGLLVERRIVHHVLDEHAFEDATLYYRFYADEPAASRPTTQSWVGEDCLTERFRVSGQAADGGCGRLRRAGLGGERRTRCVARGRAPGCPVMAGVSRRRCGRPRAADRRRPRAGGAPCGGIGGRGPVLELRLCRRAPPRAPCGRPRDRRSRPAARCAGPDGDGGPGRSERASRLVGGTWHRGPRRACGLEPGPVAFGRRQARGRAARRAGRRDGERRGGDGGERARHRVCGRQGRARRGRRRGRFSGRRGRRSRDG